MNLRVILGPRPRSSLYWPNVSMRAAKASTKILLFGSLTSVSPLLGFNSSYHFSARLSIPYIRSSFLAEHTTPSRVSSLLT